MATVLEGLLEGHDGPEPRVKTADVQRILNFVIGAEDESGKSVALLAERSGYSTRTVYRVLQATNKKPDLSLKLADALVTAAGSHLRHCTLVWPEQVETAYTHV